MELLSRGILVSPDAPQRRRDRGGGHIPGHHRAQTGGIGNPDPQCRIWSSASSREPPNSRPRTSELEQAREREIEIGFRIQQTLLLDQPPADVPGLRVAALTIPSQRIDGDFYIFLRHSDESLDVIVGDVMGKGIPAALLGAATKSHFLRALSDLMALSKDGRLPEPKDIVMLAHAGAGAAPDRSR